MIAAPRQQGLGNTRVYLLVRVLMTGCLNLIMFGDDDIIRNLNFLARRLLYPKCGNPRISGDLAREIFPEIGRMPVDGNNPHHLIIGD